MPFRFNTRFKVIATTITLVATVAGLGLASLVNTSANTTHAAQGAATSKLSPFCTMHAQLCSETTNPWNYAGQYTGHDEPSALFYSNVPGSGNSSVYNLVLPKDPPTPPAQNGSGGTWNFQLHPAFWFGMAMCDTQSAPDPGVPCAADSDSNIYNSTNPQSANYMGKHPGTAFMEMQFYPPSWAPWPAGVSCDPTKWCAALNIDSYSSNSNTGQLNNPSCQAVGVEYVNFAFITLSGKPQPDSPPNPVQATLDTYTPNPAYDLYMGSGDRLVVDLHDTPQGFQVVIHDKTTGQTGSMTASAQNGFGQELFDPTGTSCQNIPYNFHPMYSTSSPETRVLWAAHSYNVAYSDEIGHFEYCNAVDANFNCTSAGANDPSGLDGDDTYCLSSPVASTGTTTTGCISTDNDFDGPEYQNNWPGTNKNHGIDAKLHSTPVAFTSPLFKSDENGEMRNYQRVAFETDLPRIEGSDVSSNNGCQRHLTDPNPGAGCVNPPNGASFYPIYTTKTMYGACYWVEGGPYIPGASHPAGSTSAQQYGGLIKLAYPSVGGILYLLEDFRNVLNNNPCTAPTVGHR